MDKGSGVVHSCVTAKAHDAMFATQVDIVETAAMVLCASYMAEIAIRLCCSCVRVSAASGGSDLAPSCMHRSYTLRCLSRMNV
jgi:hypothetical protein